MFRKLIWLTNLGIFLRHYCGKQEKHSFSRKHRKKTSWRPFSLNTITCLRVQKSILWLASCQGKSYSGKSLPWIKLDETQETCLPLLAIIKSADGKQIPISNYRLTTALIRSYLLACERSFIFHSCMLGRKLCLRPIPSPKGGKTKVLISIFLHQGYAKENYLPFLLWSYNGREREGR